MLFGALGVRLWFLQAVEASSLQAAVDESSLRTVLIPPVRGQIIDADGRLLAGNEATNTVAVDWAQIRKASDRATLFQRLSGWLGVPVADMEARYQADTYSRFRPLPLAEDVPENVVIAIQERYEDFPGVSVQLAYRRVYPYAPLASPRDRLHGRDHGRRPRPTTAASATTRRTAASDVGRAGIEQQYETTLHGTWGRRVVRDRRRRPGGARGQRDAAGQRPGHPAVDRPRPAAVRRADAADSSCASSGRSSPRTRSSRSPTAATSGWTSARARRCTTRPRPAR